MCSRRASRSRSTPAEQRVVVVEVGAGLRSYTVGGHDVLDATRPTRWPAPGAARCSCPGPTGSRTAPTSSPAPGTTSRSPSPGHATRSTASCAGSPWTVGERDADRVVHGAHAASPARLSVLARAQRRVRAVRGRPPRDLDGDQHRTRRLPVRERPAPVPDGRHRDRRPGRPPRAGAHACCARTNAGSRSHRCPSRAPSSTSGSRGRSARPSSTTPTPTSSATTTDVARVELRHPDGIGAHALGRRELPVPGALHRRSAAERPPAKPRRRADDLPAQRVPDGRQRRRARAGRDGDGRLGHRDRRGG